MRKMMIAAALAIAASAHAQDDVDVSVRGNIADQAHVAYRAEIAPCQPPEKSGALDCIKQRFRSADATLNAVYRGRFSFLNEAPPSVAAQLRASERAWIKFRDENCALARMLYRGLPGAGGGDYTRMLYRGLPGAGGGDYYYYDCMLWATIERTKELSSQIGD